MIAQSMIPPSSRISSFSSTTAVQHHLYPPRTLHLPNRALTAKRRDVLTIERISQPPPPSAPSRPTTSKKPKNKHERLSQAKLSHHRSARGTVVRGPARRQHPPRHTPHSTPYRRHQPSGVLLALLPMLLAAFYRLWWRSSFDRGARAAIDAPSSARESF